MTVAYSGLKIDHPEYMHFKDNKLPEYLAMFPHRKMPAFKSTSGFALVEGAAIAHYREYGITMIGPSVKESELFNNTVFTWLLCQGKFSPYSKEVRPLLSIYNSLFTITFSSCMK